MHAFAFSNVGAMCCAGVGPVLLLRCTPSVLADSTTRSVVEATVSAAAVAVAVGAAAAAATAAGAAAAGGAAAVAATAAVLLISPMHITSDLDTFSRCPDACPNVSIAAMKAGRSLNARRNCE